MRVNISAHIPTHLHQTFGMLPLVLTIKTARGLPAQSQHKTTAEELLTMLDRRTDVNSADLDRFRQKLRRIEDAQLSNVEMSDELLQMLGFLVD